MSAVAKKRRNNRRIERRRAEFLAKAGDLVPSLKPEVLKASGRSWEVHEADHDSVVFVSPEGQRYTASCVFGNFAYEGEEAFDCVRRGPLTAERLREKFRMPRSAKGAFKVEFPDILGRVGRCVQGDLLRGFRLFTPSRHMLDFHFLRRPAPIELKAELEALFGA